MKSKHNPLNFNVFYSSFMRITLKLDLTFPTTSIMGTNIEMNKETFKRQVALFIKKRKEKKKPVTPIKGKEKYCKFQMWLKR